MIELKWKSDILFSCKGINPQIIQKAHHIYSEDHMEFEATKKIAHLKDDKILNKIILLKQK